MSWALGISIVSVIISVISLIWNWHHSETLFRKNQYPPIGWLPLDISKSGDNTIVKVRIRNFASKDKDIIDVGLNAYLCRGFMVKAWCTSEKRIDRVTGDEEVSFHVTEVLESDIAERFNYCLIHEQGWLFKHKPKRFKAIIEISYLPLFSDVDYLKRKSYFLFMPITDNNLIKSWEIKSIPSWQGWLPWF